MNTETGIIRDVTEQEPLQTDEVLISEHEKRILELYNEKERMAILNGLRSKNKSSKRRVEKILNKGIRRGKR